MTTATYRPSLADACIYTARIWAERSPDTKTQVGAVIATTDGYKVRGVGYNGPPKGLHNERVSPNAGQSGFIHAEINALLNSDLNAAIDHTLFVTHEPCYNCAVAIINKGCIGVVVFEKEYYRDGSPYSNPDINTSSGIVLLMSAGIHVYMYTIAEGETIKRMHRITQVTEYREDAKSKPKSKSDKRRYRNRRNEK